MREEGMPDAKLAEPTDTGTSMSVSIPGYTKQQSKAPTQAWRSAPGGTQRRPIPPEGRSFRSCPGPLALFSVTITTYSCISADSSDAVHPFQGVTVSGREAGELSDRPPFHQETALDLHCRFRPLQRLQRQGNWWSCNFKFFKRKILCNFLASSLQAST